MPASPSSFPQVVAAPKGVLASLEGGEVIVDGVALVPKFAAIAAASSGDNTALAAVTGKKIRVLSLFLVSAGTVSVRFESGAGGTALTGVMPLVAQSQINLPFSPTGHFQTAAGALLNIELSGAVAVAGHFTYIEV